MKILIVTPYIPHSLAGHGGSEYVFGLMKYLSMNHEVTVISFLDDFEETLVNDLKKYPVKFRFIKRKKGKQKSFFGNIGLFAQRAVELISSIILWQPYFIAKYRDSRMAQAIEDETTTTKYDAVQIEFTQMAQYVTSVKSGTTTLRQHDVNIRPWLRLYQNTGNIFKKLAFFLEYTRWLKYEPNIIKKFDVVLTFTETDSKFLSDTAHATNVYCNPRGIEVPEKVTEYDKREPNSLLFVGVYNHTANRDSVLWLCSEIFPEIQKLCPSAVLYVVGKYPPEEITELAQKNQAIKVLGFVPALEEYYNKARVFISPVRLGGGIKTKVLHAQSYGMSIVSNAVGCDGIKSVNASNAIIAESVSDLAKGVAALFNDPVRAATMAEEGRRLVIEHYAWTSVIKELESFYQLQHYGTTTTNNPQS